MDILLRDLDLNLLRVFVAVLQTRSVTEAAARLDLSQSAVSNALARLRRACDDELFIRTPDGMTPTPYGERIAGPVSAALASVAESLAERDRFEPARARRTFTVRMSDIGEIVFVPALLAALGREAPGVSLRVVSLSEGDTGEALARGEVDLAIGFLPDLQAGWYQQRLFEQRYVCLTRREHPLAGRALSRRAFERAEHLVVESPGSGHRIVDDALAALGVERRVRLRIPDFLGAVMLVARSDFVLTAPLKLARAAAETLPLAWSPHPLALPSFAIHQYWHPRVHRDPGHQWMRGTIARLFAEPAATMD